MAGGFGRSNSLSINTGASNSLFNKPAQASGGGAFGGQNATTQAQPSGNLFGSILNNQQNPPQQAQPGSLFGNASNTGNQQQSSAPSLFGNSAASSQPQGNSLFGGTLGSQNQNQNQNQNQAQQQQGAAPTTGGFFGGLGQQNKPAAPSLFNANTAQAQQSQPKLSLFGNSTNQPQQQTSLFGNTNTQQRPNPQPTQSLFGAPLNQSTAINTNAALAGGLKLGQSTQPQGQTVPGVRVDTSQMRGTTRFNDLHLDVQKQIEAIDIFIQDQISIFERNAALMPKHGENVRSIPPDVRYIESKVDAVELAIDNDGNAVNRLRALIRADADDARQVFRAVEMLKLPPQYHYHGLIKGPGDSATKSGAGGAAPAGGSTSSIDTGAAARAAALADPGTDELSGPVNLLGYFERRSNELQEKLAKYSSQVSEIESHLGMVEATTMQEAEALAARRGAEARGRDASLKELGQTLRDFEKAVLRVAGHVGGVREKLVEVSLGAAGRR